MRIIAFINEGPVIREILGHLGEPISAPRLAPARGPPLWEQPEDAHTVQAGRETVSYTHLDVYKRQVQHLRQPLCRRLCRPLSQQIRAVLDVWLSLIHI